VYERDSEREKERKKKGENPRLFVPKETDKRYLKETTKR